MQINLGHGLQRLSLAARNDLKARLDLFECRGELQELGSLLSIREKLVSSPVFDEVVARVGLPCSRVLGRPIA